MKILLSLLISTNGAWAAEPAAVPAAPATPAPAAPPPAATAVTKPTLTLGEYLSQVTEHNPAARAARQTIIVAQMRLREADVGFSPELYAKYNLFDNRAQPSNAFSPTRTDGHDWRVGVTKKTLSGANVDAYFETTQNRLEGLSPQVPALKSFEKPALGLTVTQPLLRDAFGKATRLKLDAERATSRKTLLDAQFELKNLLLKAENSYWSVVSYGEVLRLQEENVERARRLRDYMKQKVSVNLMDDVDYLQAQVSVESRELELKTSLDQRAVAIRTFNTLRGADQDQIEELVPLPKADLLLKASQDPSKRMSREDFRSIFEQATVAAAMAQGSESMIAPKLDLVGSLSTNGMDGKGSTAQAEALAGKYPNWAVGLTFSIPLDYSLIGQMRRSYKAAKRSAEAMRDRSEYEERRAWSDLLRQNQESQERFAKSLSIESIQSELVKRERRRLLDGRSTTFQTITFENNLAGAQVSRVQAQLDLVQKHNLIKQFEEIK